MARHPTALFAILLAVFAWFGTNLPAQERPAAEVAKLDVSTVRFRAVRVAEQQNSWMETEIEIQGRGSASAEAGTSRFVDFVTVELLIAYEPIGRSGQFLFFRSSCTAVSLASGRNLVRFYLPWEVLKRDNLPSTEPTYWLVQLKTPAGAVDLSSKARSSRFKDDSVVASFLQRAATEAAATDGILVPQHDSPFVGQNLRDVPSFVRKPSP